jgi:hypothetical protein
MRVCSLFSVLGVVGDVKVEAEYAASLAGLSVPDFLDWIRHFRGRGILQQRSRLRSGTTKTSRTKAGWPIGSRVWTSIAQKNCFPTMGCRVRCERLCASNCGFLDAVADAREIAAALCGSNGPFGQAEVLSSAHGSECFRYIAEIAPGAACAALQREFGHLSSDELRQIRDGRRILSTRWSG